MSKPAALNVIQKRNQVADLASGVSDAEQALAQYLEVDLKVPAQVLVDRIKSDTAHVFVASLRIGLRLLALKAQCEHGAFEASIQEAGIGVRDGQSCMQLAKAFAVEGDERRRDVLLEMGKTKAVALLSARPEVRDEILKSPELLAEALEGSKREFQAQVARLEKKVLALETERDNRANAKTIASAGHVIAPDVPYQVTDVRREVAALYEQASLAIRSLADLAPVLEEARSAPRAEQWIQPTAMQAFTALKSLHAAIELQAPKWVDGYDLDTSDLPPVTDRAYYTPEEAVLVEKQFESLRTAHLIEGKRRIDTRANEVPGKLGAKRKVK